VEKAFVDFVRGGKGFALFHAASATFHNWPEYQQMVGATWKLGTTGHGPMHTFKVTVKDKSHPVTAGMPDFEIRDELWHRMGTQPNIHVLCEAFSAKDKDGSGLAEPVAICTQFGKGRCFYNELGHDATVLKNDMWQTLMLRGTEWAATGKVAIPVPSDRMPAGYQWRQTDKSLALVTNGKVVWRFNFAGKLGKPYFHPLALTDGTELTWDSPPDHPWHHGLWFSWKFINGLNYWEENRQTGLSQGRNELLAVKVEPREDYSARIEMTIAYHPPDKPTVLTETRRIDVSAPDEQGRYRMDWAATFTAAEQDVLLDRTAIPGEKDGKAWGGYAGLSVRIAKDISKWQVIGSEGKSDMHTHGKKARWMGFSGQAPNGKQAGIAVLDHPGNLRHPSPWYVSLDTNVPFGYFSPAILFDGPYTLPAGESLTLRYRVLVHPGRADSSILKAEFRAFSKLDVKRQVYQKRTTAAKGPAKSAPGLDRVRGILNEFKARRFPRRKKIEFCGLDLTNLPKTTNPAELPDLYAADPNDPNKVRLRSDIILARHPKQWSKGVAYYCPAGNRYYISLEPGHPGRNPYYGPFEGKPWKKLGITEPNAPPARRRFAIHLVLDPVDVGRPNDVTLNKLQVAPVPIISEKDLLGYDWSGHILRLRPKVTDRLPSPKSVWGIPFVVVADGRPCYLGAFWAAGSSYLPKVPMAYTGIRPGLTTSKDSLQIGPVPIAGAKDPRNNIRLRTVLEELGFVQADRPAPRPRPRAMSLQQQLDMRVDVSHWNLDTTFGTAIEDLKNSVDPPLRLVVLWRDLYDYAGIQQDTRIRMDGLSNIPLRVALNSLLMAITGNPNDIGFIVEGGVVTVAAKDSLRVKWKTRVYDIADLL